MRYRDRTAEHMALATTYVKPYIVLRLTSRHTTHVEGGTHIPVVHSSLTTSTALRLGARRLSSAVMELPDGPLTPVAPGDLERLLGPAAAPALNSQLVVWNTNLRARALRVSVRRAV